MWARWFPDPNDRPPHKYVPVALPPGQQVQLAVFAMCDGRRQVLEIPGLAHGDPMSMGLRMGDLLFSSRIFAGTGGDSETTAAAVCDNVRALLQQAGATPAQLTQILAFVKTEGDRVAADSPIQRLVNRMSGPRVRFLNADLPGNSIVRFEVIASLEGAH